MPRAAASARFAIVTTASVTLVAVLGPILGAMADYARLKKKMFSAFLLVGVLGTAGLIAVGRGDWKLGAFLLLLGNVGITGTTVFYESFLPHVARRDETDRLATTGFAAGYVGGGLLLALNLAWIQRPALFGIPSAEVATRLSFLSAAIWWLLFSIPFLRRVKEPERRLTEGEAGGRGLWAAAFGRLGETLHHLKTYRNAFLLLLAVTAYNDGISTIIRLGTTYGTEIGIPQAKLIASVLWIQIIGIPFSILFGSLARRIGTKPAIFVGLFGYALIALIGYTMTTALHFFALATLLGMVQGGTQALSRSLFASLIPPSRSSEFFGFFGVVDKFSGILGPALFAVTTTATGSGRPAILGLLAFFAVGGLFLARVDVEAGRRVAAEGAA